MKSKPKKTVASSGQSGKNPAKKNLYVPNHAFTSPAIIIALITFVLYLPTLKNGFVNWDDYPYILDNIPIRHLDWAFFRWAFSDTGVAMYWHPLTWISHAVDYALWGRNPAGHHGTSILLHALNTGITVWLTNSLLDVINDERRITAGTVLFDQRALLIISSVTGLLFGIHPLHVESVAWIAMRKDLLYSLFYLLSLIIYIRYARSLKTSSFRQAFYLDERYYGALLLFFLALSSKPMAVSFPLVLLLLDWYPLRRFNSGKNLVPLLIEKLPFAVISGIITVVTVISQRSADISDLTESYPLSTRIPAALRALVIYCGKIILPTDLLPLYLYPAKLSLTSPQFLLAATAIALIMCGCFFMARRQPFWLAAVLFFSITLSPALGINQVGSDRYIYLPALGLFLLMGLAANKIWTITSSKGIGARSFTLGVATALLVSLLYITVKQIAIWEDSATLWNYVIAHGPPNPSAFNSRGHVYKNAGAFDKAIIDYSMAIALKPYWATYYVNRGTTYCEKGEYAKAVDDLNKAVSLKSADYMVFNNRGAIYFRKGDFDLALADFNTSIMLKPDGHLAYNNRGMVLKSKGENRKAIGDFDKAIAISPDYSDAYYNRSVLNSEKGDLARAIDDLDRVLSLNPAQVGAYLDRGDLHQRNGNRGAAIKDYQKACSGGNKIACDKAVIK